MFEITGKQWNAIVDIVNSSVYHGYEFTKAVREDMEIEVDIKQDGLTIDVFPAEFTVKPE